MISTQCGEHNLLRRSGGLSGILHQLGGFGPAYPMARLHRLQMNFQPKFPHFTGHVLNRGLCLGRSHRARADVFGDVGHLLVGVIVGQGSIANRCKLLNKCRRQWNRGRRLRTIIVGINRNSLLLGKENARGQGQQEKKACVSHVEVKTTSIFG